MNYIILYVILILSSVLWLSYEIWRAPLLDDNYKVIQEEKTFRDLLKKFRLWK
jgi:hypothetical protein